MLFMTEKAKREGISQVCSKRYAEANNKYLPDYLSITPAISVSVCLCVCLCVCVSVCVCLCVCGCVCVCDHCFSTTTGPI